MPDSSTDHIRTIIENIKSYHKLLDFNKQTYVSSENNQTGQVDSNVLVKYCKYSGAAYKVSGTSWDCSENCKSDETKGTIVDHHWANAGAPSYGYIAHKDDTQEIIVSWRGSTVLMDWIADFSFAPVMWPPQIDGSMVHTGFLKAYNGEAESIKQIVGTLVSTYPSYRIILTGHSLGGAQAALAAVDFALSYPEWTSKMEIYTYGEPRVGNSQFADWFSRLSFPIYRVVNKGDIVAQVPFRQMGYQHHAQEVWYDSSSDQIHFCGRNSENVDCQDGLRSVKLSFLNHLQYAGLSYEVLYFFLANLDISH
ncbi:hypothetical protein IWW45_007183 [Coemansia sp. RSA 485]|nr:hypothetical protein IWW45_007183 [Coemansia sp. RSA 485]